MVVEDDPVTRSMIARYFTNEGFTVEEAGSVADFRAAPGRARVDIVFIDIGLPDGDGLALAREIRALSPAGIIFVTQQDTEVDRIVGLETAADDYVTKPVNLRELLARARALLRRRSLEAEVASRRTVVTFGPWVLDLMRRELATRAGGSVFLTRGEFDLLAALVTAGGQTLHRDYLVEVISNRQQDSDVRTVDALVVRLRRKMKPFGGAPAIATVVGSGYRLGLTIDPY
jgi:two-component system, OmpR family, torCAD operon response regulator TorR